MAQQEDTLRLKLPSVKPELIIPSQPMPAHQSLMPSKLSVDGFSYLSSTPKDTIKIAPNLSVENFLKLYYKDFLKWEKDTYGVNFNGQDFVMKNGKYIMRNAYAVPKRKPGEKAPEAPYPLHPGFVQASTGIAIEWAPSKHDRWFKENFGFEKRAIQIMGSQVDSFGNRSIYEVQNLLRVDSILKQSRIASTGQHSPTPISYKKKIKQLRRNIREGARQDLKARKTLTP